VGELQQQQQQQQQQQHQQQHQHCSRESLAMLREYCFFPCHLLSTNLSDFFFQLFFFGKASLRGFVCPGPWPCYLRTDNHFVTVVAETDPS